MGWPTPSTPSLNTLAMPFILNRFLQMLVTLLIMATMVFLAIRLTPGDPAQIFIGDVGSPHQYESLRELMGLDRPLYVQYAEFLQGLFTADLGESLFDGRPVMDRISRRILPTVTLALTTMVGVVLLGVPLGLLSAAAPGSFLDTVIRMVTYSVQAVANFWLAILLIMFFSIRLRWFPAFGAGGPSHLVLPAVSLGIPFLARVVRFVRGGILEVLDSDFVRTARSKGLSEVVVVTKHAFRVTLIPLITDLGLRLGWLLGGTVIIETVFAWPGLGSLTVEAVRTRDYPLVEGSVLILSAFFLVTNFFIDLSYGLLDPRVRYG